jgi:hypothetical protein
MSVSRNAHSPRLTTLAAVWSAGVARGGEIDACKHFSFPTSVA